MMGGEGCRKMENREVALLVPYNDNLEILFQDRKEINKKHSMDYGFFGGGIEEGESVEEALAREIQEELSVSVDDLKDLGFFKQYSYTREDIGISRVLNVFLCKMPDMESLDIQEGKGEVFKIEDAINLNISDMDKQILEEILNHLRGALK